MSNLLASTLTILLQVVLSSTILSFTHAESPARPAALPLLGFCIYHIVTRQRTRPAWASSMGAITFALGLQYIDLALLSKWSFESHHRLEAIAIQRRFDSEYGTKGALETTTELSERNLKAVSGKRDGKLSFRDRLWFGWCSMWSFRHLNSSYEAKNAPPFSKDDPHFIPDLWGFILRQTLSAVLSYLIIDIIEAGSPPPQKTKEILFDPALIPVFRRLNTLTSEHVILRTVGTAAFWLNLYCMIQGVYAAVSVIGVISGLSGVRDWRPVFGDVADAWTLRRFWGRYWHQSFRRILTEPSFFLTRKILRLPEHSLLERYSNIFLTFTLSGILHTTAVVSGGMPLSEPGTLQFFCTQAIGIMVEDGIQACYKFIMGANKGGRGLSLALLRCIGYVWVAGFLVWSSPAWFYPLAIRPAIVGPDRLLPSSIVQAVKTRYHAFS